MKSGILKKVWDWSGYILGGYAIYKQLNTANQAKDDLYQNLSPEQRKTWDGIFGKPVPVTNPFPSTPKPGTITELKAGV